MARARSLKPGFFQNEELAALGYEAMLVFAGLWTIADREGRLEDRPARIKIQVLPYGNADVELALCSLSSAGFIIRYKSQGKNYIAIPTWKKHQNPHCKEAPSTIPAPCSHSASTGNSGTSPALTLNPEPLTLNPELDSLNPEPSAAATPRPGETHALSYSGKPSTPESPIDEAQWQEYIGVFLAAGKHLNETDIGHALRQWVSIEPDERSLALHDIRTRAIGTSAQYIPLPVNHLTKKPWTRRGPGRLMPEPVPPKPKSRGEIAQERASQIFLATATQGEPK